MKDSILHFFAMIKYQNYLFPYDHYFLLFIKEQVVFKDYKLIIDLEKHFDLYF